VQTTPIRRQPHGIKRQQITITFPAVTARRLRREASERGISISRHVTALIETAWAVRDHLGTSAATDESEVA